MLGWVIYGNFLVHGIDFCGLVQVRSFSVAAHPSNGFDPHPHDKRGRDTHVAMGQGQGRGHAKSCHNPQLSSVCMYFLLALQGLEGR